MEGKKKNNLFLSRIASIVDTVARWKIIFKEIRRNIVTAIWEQNGRFLRERNATNDQLVRYWLGGDGDRIEKTSPALRNIEKSCRSLFDIDNDSVSI
jgi:hypothetical protein